jgi:hypothetical protein
VSPSEVKSASSGMLQTSKIKLQIDSESLSIPQIIHFRVWEYFFETKMRLRQRLANDRGLQVASLPVCCATKPNATSESWTGFNQTSVAAHCTSPERGFCDDHDTQASAKGSDLASTFSRW